MNKLFPLVFLSACTVAAPGLQAESLERLVFPDSVDWFFHLDANQLRSSQAGSAFLREFRELGRQQLPKELPIDPMMVLDNIQGLTLFGAMPESAHPSPEELDAVVLLQGTPGLMQVLRGVISGLQIEQPELISTMSVGDSTILVLQDGQFNGCFIGDDSLVMAKQLTSLQRYLAVRSGMTGRLAFAERFPSYAADDDAGIFLGLHVEGLEVFDNLPAQARILKMTRAVSLQVGESNGSVNLLAGLATEDPVIARQVSEVLRGVIALTMMTQTGQPDIAALLGSTRVNLDGDRVQLRMAYPSAAVEQWAAKLAESAKAALAESQREAAEKAEEAALSAAERAEAEYEAALEAAERAREAAEEARRSAEEARKSAQAPGS